MIRTISKSLLALLMVSAGILHFVRYDFFLKIVPDYLPFPLEIVYVSGVCEIALGVLLLIRRFSHLAAWGIVALFIAVFPANIYAYQHQELIPAPPIAHFLRLPLQGLLILWAYSHTRRVNTLGAGETKLH